MRKIAIIGSSSNFVINLQKKKQKKTTKNVEDMGISHDKPINRFQNSFKKLTLTLFI